MALLCSCHLVSDRQIAAHVDEGADSLSAVQELCGAGTSCGGCLRSIEDLVEQLSSSFARSAA